MEAKRAFARQGKYQYCLVAKHIQHCQTTRNTNAINIPHLYANYDEWTQ